MKYTNDQIKDKYKENAKEILRQLNLIKKELTEDELVINFNGKDDVSVNNNEQISKEFSEDFKLIFEPFYSKNLIRTFNLDSFDLEKDIDRYVEFITLEDKIFKTSIIPLKFIHMQVICNLNTDKKNRDDFIACLPSLFFYNTKTGVLTTNFLANTLGDINKGIFHNQKLFSSKADLKKRPEIRPNLKVVNGGKE